MKILRNKRRGICVLGLVLLLMFASCGRASKHCYLCQGIPYDAPCLVDLATGSIAPLTVSGDNGAVSIQFLGKARVVSESEAAHAMIPAEPQAVNGDLFCEDCMALVDATSNRGYFLADLSDLTNIQLYPIEAGEAIVIRGYDISAAANGDHIQIQVAAPMEE